MWTREQAIELCTAIHQFSPGYGCYVALTGGLLYKDGPRKDCDILFYRIRQVEGIDKKGLFEEMQHRLGIKVVKGFGFCHKALWEERTIDLLFPEEDRVCEAVTVATGISGETLSTELVPTADEFKPEDPLIASITEAQVAQEA